MGRFAARMNAELVNRRMVAACVTPAQLAKDAGVSEDTVFRARHGRPVTLESCQRIATTLMRYESNEAVVAFLPDVGG